MSNAWRWPDRSAGISSIACCCMATARWSFAEPGFDRHRGGGYDAGRGDVAQLGEHLLCKEGVRGSSPLISTTKSRRWRAVAAVDRHRSGCYSDSALAGTPPPVLLASVVTSPIDSSSDRCARRTWRSSVSGYIADAVTVRAQASTGRLRADRRANRTSQDGEHPISDARP